MNLIEAAESLENVPFEQLIKISQGNADPEYQHYPKLVAIDEVKRRTADKKSYIAQLAAMNQPKKSVSENLIDDYKQLANINPQNMMISPEDSVANPEEIMMNLQNSVMNNQMAGIPNEVGSMVDENVNPASSLRQDIVMPETMQMAASGGLVGYQEGGATAERGIFGNITDFIGYDDVKRRGEMTQAERDQEIKDYYAKNKPFGNFKIPRNEDGTIDKSELATDVGLTALGAALLRGQGPKIVGIADKIGSKISGPAKKLYDKATKQSLTLERDASKPLGDAAKSLGLSGKETQKVLTKKFSPSKLTGIGGTGIIGGATLQELLESPESPPAPPAPPAVTVTDDPVNLPTADTEEKGLLGISKEQGLNLTKLAALVGGSSNMKEFFTGLGGLAESIEEKESTSGLSEAQKGYYLAQTEKLGAETKLLPLTNLRKDFAEIVDLYKALQEEGSEQSVKQAAALLPTIQSYRDELAKAQGFSSTDAESNIKTNLEKSGITVS
jgi:hypothetical protein|tara:strand:+ start:116 stop:1615 length:1500 start_codon:yes stop_codon:yes gene_type:complete